jgi:hypothetical protein
VPVEALVTELHPIIEDKTDILIFRIRGLVLLEDIAIEYKRKLLLAREKLNDLWRR